LSKLEDSVRALLIATGLVFVISGNSFSSSQTDRDTCDNPMKDMDAIIAACTNIIASGEQVYSAAVTYRRRGDAYYYKHDYDLAIADYDQAIKLNPQPEVYYDRGKAFHSRGDLDQALFDFGQAIQLNSRFALAYIGRGNVFNEKHEFERAIAEYNQALKFNITRLSAYYGRGMAYYNKHDYERAIDDFEQVLQLNPNHKNAAKALEAAKLNRQLNGRANKKLSL
jgi:tetratricopeptide (TPR) repeat protein